MEKRFSLRKLTIGLCSVALSAVILSTHNNVVQADSMSNQTATEVQKADPAVSKIDDQETSDKPKIKPNEKQNNRHQSDNKKEATPKPDQKPIVIDMSYDVVRDVIWGITQPVRAIRENHDIKQYN